MENNANEMAINGGITLNFLYQLIGQKEVEKAVLIEQLLAVRGEVERIRGELAMAETSAAAVDNAIAGAAECDSRPETPPEPTD